MKTHNPETTIRYEVSWEYSPDGVMTIDYGGIRERKSRICYSLRSVCQALEEGYQDGRKHGGPQTLRDFFIAKYVSTRIDLTEEEHKFLDKQEKFK